MPTCPAWGSPAAQGAGEAKSRFSGPTTKNRGPQFASNARARLPLTDRTPGSARPSEAKAAPGRRPGPASGGRNSATATPSLRYDRPRTLPPDQEILLTT